MKTILNTQSSVSLLVFLFIVLIAGTANAKPSANVKSAVDRVENTGEDSQRVLIPYMFSTEGMGLTFGVGGWVKGFYQDQMTIGGTVYGGPENYGMAAGLWDFRFPQSARLYLSAIGLMGYFPRQKGYAAPRDLFWPPDLPRPGSNESSSEQVVEAAGVSNWWELKLEYALPIGATREQGMIYYQLEQGMLTSEPSGGKHWNPLSSGATVVMLKHYSRYRTFELEDITLSASMHAFELGLLYDNTDFPINPSFGSSQYVALHHDPAWFDSYDKWSYWEFEASKYFSIGDSRHALQRVFALNFWTAYSPTWRLEYNDQGGSRIVDAPPITEGPNLGGFYRMRGYDQDRFQDKMSIYSTVEYRYTLRWNPLRDVSWLQFLASDWVQLVAFAEGGRVAPGYTSEYLFNDWRSDAGFALRLMFGGVVVRLDWARSDEGSNVWAMVGHPF